MGIFTSIFNITNTLLSWLKERAKGNQELKMSEIEAKKNIILSHDKANTEWEIAQLMNTDKWMRWAAFLLFASPLIASFISPSWGQWVSKAWHTMPLWQENVLSGMCLAVFGLKSVPRIVGSSTAAIINAIRRPILPIPRDTKK